MPSLLQATVCSLATKSKRICSLRLIALNLCLDTDSWIAAFVSPNNSWKISARTCEEPYPNRFQILEANEHILVSKTELPEPFNKGFNTLGLWNRSRHPNYLGEQGFWLALYFVVIGSGMVTYNFFSYTLIGPLLLIFIFLGSSSLQEGISSKKYPEYSNYVNKVSKYIPLRKYR